jgi:hypothetical protein
MSSKEFSRQTFQWLYQVNHDRDLPSACKSVALELTVYFTEDDDGGRAFPGYRTIADAIGVSDSTVIRSIKLMHARGHLRVVWGSPGRGHPNQYWMILKPLQAEVLDHVNTPPAEVLEPTKPPQAEVLAGKKTSIHEPENLHSEAENLHSCKIKPPPAGQNHKTNHKKNHKGEPHASDGPPISTHNVDVASISISDQQEDMDFERFWAACPKQVNKAAAKRAWPAARKKAPAEEIIAGIVRYANDPVRLAQSHGPEGDRYTKSPANWLIDERWTDKPTVGNVIDEHGNLIAAQGEDDDLVAQALAWAAENYPNGGRSWN